ncbi:MAG: insulinase family protein [Planctomycetes bacterium]|nr:insulinase family protein [Planctomycetota bacterium]
MSAAGLARGASFVHAILDNGVEFAADPLPERQTAALCFRMLTGIGDDPAELTGVGALTERTLSKGTARYDGRALADAFDALGVKWSTLSGRQSTLVRVVCLPEYVPEVVELTAELLCRPTFPEEACRVALELAQQDLRHMEDEPQELLRLLIQRLTLGPVWGRYPGGDAESLARITRDSIVARWEQTYHAGRLQLAVAGPVEADALTRQIERCFAGLGEAAHSGRAPVDFTFQPERAHREKDLQQEYIAITLPGAARTDGDFPTEQVALGVLAGGMSGRLFTEVREKLGLVYWVGAWHEHPRGAGIIHLGASTTPENCTRTYETLLRELERLSEDLTEEETRRARDGLIAHYGTEDDLTRARAASLSDDLFHFARPIGLGPKVEALRKVTVADVADYVRRLPRDRICVASLGPRAL